jgi:hypothetical protein
MALGKNGYAPSILTTESGRCYICKKYGDTARHEIYGAANRQISKRAGLWIYVCPRCHDVIHLKPDDGLMDRTMKKIGQSKYLESHTREEWLKMIGRFYDD